LIELTYINRFYSLARNRAKTIHSHVYDSVQARDWAGVWLVGKDKFLVDLHARLVEDRDHKVALVGKVPLPKSRRQVPAVLDSFPVKAKAYLVLLTSRMNSGIAPAIC
jgi:hypothetical protein